MLSAINLLHTSQVSKMKNTDERTNQIRDMSQMPMKRANQIRWLEKEEKWEKAWGYMYFAFHFFFRGSPRGGAVLSMAGRQV